MTERAKRAVAELERRGWSLSDEYSKDCIKCGGEMPAGSRYCAQCGEKAALNFDATTLEDIEAAIAAAVDAP